MNVIVKKKALDQVIKALAEERSFHSRRYDQLASDERPVMPDAQIAAQISSTPVPVEDPDFLPVNNNQLSSAASQIAKKVAPDKLQKFYSGLKKLIRKTSEPSQFKGMSETDLLEALRPLVVREAKLLSFIGQDTGDDEDDDGSSTDTGFRSGPTSDRPEGPPKRKVRKSAEDRKAAKIVKKAAKAKAADAPIVSIGGKKLNSREIDELEAMRQRWTMAPDLIQMRQIKEQEKLDLADVVSGDANRLLDIFEKAELDLPSTLEEAQISIQVEDGMTQLKNFDEQTPYRRIKFTDIAQPPREKIADALKTPILHTGGPIEVTAEYADGRKEDQVYYLVKNFPFNQQEYVDAFGSALAKARSERHEEALTALKKREEREQRKLDAAATGTVDKKKRASTMQAEIGSEFARAEAQNMRSEDPSGFEKQLKKIGISLSDFESMSGDEQDDTLEKIAKNIERDRYQKVGLMARGRPSILDPDIEDIEPSEEGLVSKSIFGAAPETLAELFFEKAYVPIAQYVYETVVEDDPEADIDEINETMGLNSYEKFRSINDMRDWISLIVRSCQNLITNPETGEEIEERVPGITKLFSLVSRPTLSAADEKRLEKLGLDEISTVRYLFTKESDEQLSALIRAVELATKYTILSKRDEVTPLKIKHKIMDYIDENSIDVFKKYGKEIEAAMRKQGLLKDNEDFTINSLSSMNAKEIYDIIGEKILATRMKRDDMNTPEIEEKVGENIENFLDEMDAQFETMASAFADSQSKSKKGKKINAAKSTKENVNAIVKFAYDAIDTRKDI